MPDRVSNRPSWRPRIDLDGMRDRFARGGWNDLEIDTFVRSARDMGRLRERMGTVWNAIFDPELPADGHRDPRFFEALAWYVDQKVIHNGDGRLTKAEVGRAIKHYGQEYASRFGDKSARMQSWKMIQKLRMLEREIGADGHYPYDASRMSAVRDDAWNRANTVDSRAEFMDRVIAGSHDKPVLVKFGLTYCAHCLLLEQLGSVPAVARKYENDIDTVKLWWNPNDRAMAEITAVAREQGVTSSPFFILYENGEPVRSGYAFPDENGGGMEELLRGYVD